MSATWGILIKKIMSNTDAVTLNNNYINMEFDVVTSEEHTWTSEVTSNPVEYGELVCDHVQRKADTLTLSGVISNASLQRWRGYVWEKISELLNRESNVQIAFDQFRKIMDDKQPVTIYTRYRNYPDMVMTSLSIPRKKEDGDAIEFSASFTHIKRVTTLLVDSEEAGINPEQSDTPETGQKSSGKQNRGKEQPISVDNETAKKADEAYNSGSCGVGGSCSAPDDNINDPHS
ncbi:hypothetical protein I2492_03200 [Budviciaceae bacterium CWB-B4]|uniref:Dit-like phage tail protein N-terminal domain-containing protein n=1 Tax=Limnobaculum xujianqingii TaxID=2738837 RepID=A0A9D7AFX4_9GAMM|nr:hypothetical protein [Limnobaculum xujianqingii]MBK5072025.1 hypothetical protein [Limnobaculum xujianqingii]MBK5175334.1 hypothetical protein [Limnobaculum xujianqingii]